MTTTSFVPDRNTTAGELTRLHVEGEMMDSKELVLCYVRDNWAYFTDKPLAKQWGDDWNDTPYEHNAGEPYEYAERLAFDGEFDQPCTNQCNSPYSVERINAGAIPWLVTSRWSSGKVVSIPAGTGIDEFIMLVMNAGGEVYRKIAK